MASIDEFEPALYEPEPQPDALSAVVEVADMMSVFAAQRLVRVGVMRREALADPSPYSTRDGGIAERSLRLELASALRVSEYRAGELLTTAEAVTERYPEVLECLFRAQITEHHAELLVAGLDSAEPEHRDVILARGLTLARVEPVGSFLRLLRKLIDTVRAANLQERHHEALATRRVAVQPAEDGMAWLYALIPAVEAHAIHGRLTAMATALRGRGDTEETRTLDHLRADILGDLLIDGATDGIPLEARGIRATVVVTVPALSLLEEGERAVDPGAMAASPILGTAEPATVEGVGPIPLDRARELCGGDSQWIRILTHPETGIVLSIGREHYRPPPALRRLVRWRAERCMAPGCSVPATRCQIDHNVAWEHGGHTELCNFCPFCQGHHTVKHHGGWVIRQLPGSGGAIEWTSPAGRSYTVLPERAVPVFTAGPPAPPF